VEVWTAGRFAVTLLVVACSGAPPNTETRRPPVEPASASDGGDAGPANDEAAADGGVSDAQKEFLLADPDRDGLPNSEDKCPRHPGKRSTRPERNGCPGRLQPPEPTPLLLPFTFPEKSATIPPNGYRLLQDVEAYLSGYPRHRLLVVGLSESSEPKGLARKRAQATIDYLVSKGFAGERFEIEARPSTEHRRTPSEREEDRKVVFRILVDEASAEP
jgi:outer membrane protein OmpA-like peptidoglycan-associated protein